MYYVYQHIMYIYTTTNIGRLNTYVNSNKQEQSFLGHIHQVPKGNFSVLKILKFVRNCCGLRNSHVMTNVSIYYKMYLIPCLIGIDTYSYLAYKMKIIVFLINIDFCENIHFPWRFQTFTLLRLNHELLTYYKFV